MAKRIYRVNKNGGTVCEPGGAYPPGTEIELEEERARSLGDSLELDRDGQAVVLGSREGEAVKAIESPPVDRMFRSERTTRKRSRKRK